MSSVVSQETVSGRRQSYCRKEKSLGVLCSKFLRLYNREGVDVIGLDGAAERLGVERRRIYDVVNILESVRVVARKGKNQYLWKGFGEIPRALKELREEGLKENISVSACSYSVKAAKFDDNDSHFNAKAVWEENSSCTKMVNEHDWTFNSKIDGDEYSSSSKNGNENEVLSNAKTDVEENSPSSRVESKREKSLWHLTKNFAKLFLCSDVDIITLDGAAMALLGGSHNSTAMRTKVRRLYDIANVFSTMSLIEKIPHPESRKPAYRWLGWRGKPTKEYTLGQKRLFGTEITNFSFKRHKLDIAVDLKSKQGENVDMHKEQDDLEIDYNVKMEQHSEQGTSGFVFGPFSPVKPRIGDSGNTTAQRCQDWERLSSTYRPQYRNQALSDLFGHYVEAWKSWYAELAAKEQIEQRS